MIYLWMFVSGLSLTVKRDIHFKCNQAMSDTHFLCYRKWLKMQQSFVQVVGNCLTSIVSIKGCVKCSRLVLSGYGTFYFFLEQSSRMNQSRAWFRAVLEVSCPKPKTACDIVNIFLSWNELLDLKHTNTELLSVLSFSPFIYFYFFIWAIYTHCST